ncbi:sensor histidine kinase [Hymenobacter terrenus]|uniref:sensor histidine kinase n=1 Tax=Hymenobacter terrenus TaxID=1629124 RepID=UPI000696E85F|nr:histidine kinase [Hymenobacter terrenus]
MKNKVIALLLQIVTGLAAYLAGRFFTMPAEQLLVFGPRAYAYVVLSVLIIIGSWEGSTQLYRAFRQVLFASLTPVQWVTLFSLASGLYAVLLSLAAVYFHHNVLEVLLECKPTPFKQLFLAVVFQVFLVVAVNGVRIFFRYWKTSQLLTADLTQATVRANYEALQNQVNPHFLFNSLSALTTLIYKDQDMAADFVTQLAKVYRYVLDSQRQELVPLRTELAVVQAYAFLLATRHGEGLVLEIDLTPAHDGEVLPPLSLQMLLENAVKHNRLSPESPLYVRVSREGGCLVVHNNVQRRSSPEPSTGLGLANIRQRYALLSPHPIEVTATDAFFTVKLPLLLLPTHESADSGRRATHRRTPDRVAAAV